MAWTEEFFEESILFTKVSFSWTYLDYNTSLYSSVIKFMVPSCEHEIFVGFSLVNPVFFLSHPLEFLLVTVFYQNRCSSCFFVIFLKHMQEVLSMAKVL